MLSTLLLEPVKALLIAASVFIPFERLAAAHPQQPIFRRGWAVDAVTGLVNGAILYGALMIALGAIDAGAAAAVPQLRHWIGARPIWAQAIFALVVGDLGVYASHRLAHTIPWLWRFHAVHHSAEEMDWLVGFSFHPIDLLILRIASLGPLVALHVTPAAMAIFVAVSGWQAWHGARERPHAPTGPSDGSSSHRSFITGTTAPSARPTTRISRAWLLRGTSSSGPCICLAAASRSTTESRIAYRARGRERMIHPFRRGKQCAVAFARPAGRGISLAGAIE